MEFEEAGKAVEMSLACAEKQIEESSTQDGHQADEPSIHIATGGSGGHVRFIRHTPRTLLAAARAQNAILAGADTDGVRREIAPAIHSYSPLPPCHISGLMPLFRTIASEGTLRLCEGAFSAENPLPPVPEDPAPPGAERVNFLGIGKEDCHPDVFAENGVGGRGNFHLLSVVPTQLFRILERPDGVSWLRRFGCVLVGGAPLSSEIIARSRRERIPLGIGYGMTETAAFIALQAPGDFLAASSCEAPWARILPHAQVEILAENGQILPAGHAGRVAIRAESLAPDLGGPPVASKSAFQAIRNSAAESSDSPCPSSSSFGHSGNSESSRCFMTQDEGVLEPGTGRLRILGRIDRHIITGGEKVDPRRVEAAILECPDVDAALVVGEADPEWGARVTALVELRADRRAGDWSVGLAGFVRQKLAPWCVPKRWIKVERLPFDEKGKLSHPALAQILAKR
ncbi:MAG: AMP-binding protein [Puniceicoccales bacterium]|nr:AMP-binding protein [Puniceicoccales bacterium]